MKYKFLLISILGLFIISFASASVNYNQDWFNADSVYAKQWVMKSINNDTSFTYSSSYFASLDYFSDTPNVNDSLYVAISSNTLFSGFSPYMNVYMSGTTHGLAWEYWNGTLWKSLPSIVDSTNNLTQAGTITWEIPDDWELKVVNSINYYWVKIRISDNTGITEGGRESGYPYIRIQAIYVNSSDIVTPATLLANDTAGGWGVITKTDNLYIFKVPLYFQTGATFRVGATATDYGTDLQFGTKLKPIYNYFTTGLINDFNTKYSSGMQTAVYLSNVKFYHSVGDIYFGGSSASTINNVNFYSADGRSRLRVSGDATYNNCNFYSALTYGSPKFYRSNIYTIQYIMTQPDAIYKEVYINDIYPIRTDTGSLPTIEDSTIDIYNAYYHTYWLSSGNYYNQGYFENIDNTFPQNNKAAASSEGNYWTRDIFSHKLYLKVLNESNMPISGASVRLIDKYGNDALGINLSSAYPNAKYDTNQTTIIVSDSSNFTENKFYWILGEVMNVTSIPNATAIIVERGKANTVAFNINSAFTAPRFFLLDNTTTDSNGTISKAHVVEMTIYRNGSLATTKTVYYNPVTLTITKDGYKTYNSTFNITEKTNLIITLEKETQGDWNYSWIPEFKILNKSKHTILKITDNGDLAIAGNLYENTNSPPPGVNIIWKIGNLIWLDDMGNLYLNKIYILTI